MFEKIHSLPMKQQIEMITKHLVGINSINGTKGEVQIVEELYRLLSTFPYFIRNPHHLWLQEIEHDPIGRKNVFAFVKGEEGSDKTIIYHSHIDTVGIEDYGLLKDKAFSPEELHEFFNGYESNQDVQKDALSGDWMFGRGAVDMKSGAAVHIANILYFSENLHELSGNVLLIFNGDEESGHRGIKGSIPELQRLQQEQQLEYVLAINNDFITPMYDGDDHKYIYTGAAGKVLPSFHIYGREVHVGDTLMGIDPNFIAAKITERIHNNYELTEKIPGELVLPPTILYQRDTKDIYTVQTAPSAQVYFNYFMYESTPDQILEKLLNVTKQVCQEAEVYLQKQYEQFIDVTGLPARDLSWKVDVKSYDEYVSELHNKGIDTKAVITDVLNEHKSLDLRELSFKIVRALQELDPDKKARVILFFAPPFLPHNYLKDTEERDEHIKTSIEKVLKEVENETGELFSVKKFFPFLADGSFLSIHETEEEIDTLLRNLPEGKSLYPVPVGAIKQLNVPSVNMGVYGKDGHKWTERVYMPYSFETLPTLIRKATKELLKAPSLVGV